METLSYDFAFLTFILDTLIRPPLCAVCLVVTSARRCKARGVTEKRKRRLWPQEGSCARCKLHNPSTSGN